MKIRFWRISAILFSFLLSISLCILSSSNGEDVSSVQRTSSSTVLRSNLSENNMAEGEVEEEVSGSVNDELKSSDVVQSSFEETPLPDDSYEAPSEYPFVEVVSQNAGVSSGTGDVAQGVVVTLVDTPTAELQQRAELSSQQKKETAVVNATEKSADEAEELKNSSVSATLNGKEIDRIVVEEEKVLAKKENLTEEIPSFSEWAQKQLEEAEKKREEVNTSTQNQNWSGKNASNLKVRSKNYASPDCGAKIVAANPEAVSPSSVLSPSRDEYKLNTCTSRIWFIVELCEAIQAKKIDLANFELFSSSPKDFSVSVSDRFPSRDWSNVGQFTAKDERDIQSFDLHPHLFGKYIKVELHSHHGSEHFCPISLFRVYGTSEFEVLEKEDPQNSNAPDDDEDDETLDSEKGQTPKNLFSSATDAVISIVKKAAEVLGNKANISNQTSVEDSKNILKYTPLITTCTTPSHIVVCDNCSDLLFGKVYELLSCRARQINNLLAINLIRQTLYNTPMCLQYGLDFQSKRTMAVPNIYSSYVKSFFPPRYLAALCNTIAIIENKVVLNISKQLNSTDKDVLKEMIKEKSETSETIVITEAVTPIKSEEIETTTTFIVNKIDVSTINDGIISDPLYIAQIKPTKTLTPDELIEVTSYVSNEKTLSEEVQPTQAMPEIHNQSKEDVPSHEAESSGEHISEYEAAPESAENLDLELISDFENHTNTNNVTPSPPHVKESVFMRLTNRIKTLERNMSLSSQYLEELSRRYKKQVEEMQRLLEKTIITLNEESKRKDERSDRLEEKIRQLTEIIDNLVSEKNNSFNPLHWFFLILLSIFGIFTFCRRSEQKFSTGNSANPEVQRRKSIDVVNHNAPVKKERRPSEEALKISGTYEHLMVDDTDMKKKSKERKRKKKKSLQRSNSITTLTEEGVDMLTRTAQSDLTVTFNPTRTSSPAWSRQDSAVPTWTRSNGIEEIPFVLEESDNSNLLDMPLPTPLQEATRSNGSIPVRKLSPPSFLQMTAFESRKHRKSSPSDSVGSIKELGHKKSASVDETKRQKSPAPSTGAISVNLPLDEVKAQKREKKGTFKKIFKKVF